MNNERIIKSETIKTNDRITTIMLVVDHRKEYYRRIVSTDKDWNVEMGFANRKDAVARYERDLKGLKG